MLLFRRKARTLSRTQLLHQLCYFSSSNNLLLPSENRRFQNLRIDLSSIPIPDTIHFEEQLNYSIEHWSTQGIIGLWIITPSAKSHIIPSLISKGFDFHHACPGYAVLTKWLDDSRESKLPPPASSQIGVAGIVLNRLEEVLVVQENNTHVKRKWKFPGGLCNVNENIVDGVCREVEEETGISTHFNSVLGFRQQLNSNLGGSGTFITDLYFACRLSLPITDGDAMQDITDNKINICPTEIFDAKWISLKEFAFETDSWPLNREFSQVLFRNIEHFKVENNISHLSNMDSKAFQDMKLMCDMSIKQYDSVSVPGTTFNMFLPTYLS